MAAENPGSSEVEAGWLAWLRVALLAVGLLLVSEALWLWQTWPVRELLRPTAPSAPHKP